MFGNLFGNVEENQKALKEKLDQISVEAEAGDGAVVVTVSGNREVTNVRLNLENLNLSEDREQLEDLILVAVNKALSEAKEQEMAASKEMIQEMLPPGLSNMFG